MHRVIERGGTDLQILFRDKTKARILAALSPQEIWKRVVDLQTKHQLRL